MTLLTGILVEMALLSAILIEPWYRMLYGPPRPGLACHDPNSVGLVVVLGGVGGLDTCGLGLRYVLGYLGTPYTVEVFRWGHGFGRWLVDLTDVANHEAKAQQLAALIRQFQREHPHEPVFMVAKSGGTGLAVKALEQLDPESIEQVVLIAPALSPRYDLTPALRAVGGEIVVFWSPLDFIVLGIGTKLLGTIDRVRSVSAGLVRFVAPARPPGRAIGLAPYDRLRQVKWRPSMATSGHLGGHVGPDSPRFLRKYVAPLLRPKDFRVH